MTWRWPVVLLVLLTPGWLAGQATMPLLSGTAVVVSYVVYLAYGAGAVWLANRVDRRAVARKAARRGWLP